MTHRQPLSCPTTLSVRLGMLCLTLLLAPCLGLQTAQAFTKSECALAGITRPAKLTAFLAKLRQAVQGDNKAAVAAMVAYPNEIPLKGKDVEINNAADFLKHYDEIMTKQLHDALASLKDDDVSFNRLGAILASDDEKQVIATADAKDVITIYIRGF